MSDTSTLREALIMKYFPHGLPTLWCPVLTHFDSDGKVDRARTTSHLSTISPFVRAILSPGSTGEGWEMSDSEIRGLLSVLIEAVQPLGMQILVGVLKTERGAAAASVAETARWLSQTYGGLREAGVCGFTVCPPKGADLSQDAIHDDLAAVLELGYPTALYQLPQVTENEMSPETVAELAERYPHFYLFKDTSGKDRVASSGVDLGGVFLVRGAEGEYSSWIKGGGGPYDGYLLSTANTVSPELHRILELVADGRREEAGVLSAGLGEFIGKVFDAVSGVAEANPFTNANKAIDHFHAYGRRALEGAVDERPATPMLHCGKRLPLRVVEKVGTMTEDAGFFRESPYFQR